MTGMAMPGDPVQLGLPLEVVPPLAEVEALSRELLAAEGTRLAQLRSSWGERARRATSAQMVQVERARLGFLGIAG